MTDAESRAELTRSGLNLIQQAISIFDADLRLAVSNRAYQQMFSLPPELTRPGATFGETIAYLVARGEYGTQDDPAEAERVRVDQARTFQPHYIERERPNGMVISVEGAPLADGGWIAVYTDITQVRAQERLLRARSEVLSEQALDHAERLSAANRELAAMNAALAEAKRIVTEAEARTRHVVEMMPAHIARMDADYRYTFSNNRIGAVFGGVAPDIVGQTGAEVLGASWALTRPHMDRALAGEPQVFEITQPETGRRIRIALAPDRESPGAYVLSTDVTAEVQAREALTHAARRETAAQMTSGLAHDFGNLLTVILGLQGRLDRAGLAPELAEHVQGTLAAARRGAMLLDQLAGMTSGGSAGLRPVDLAHYLDDLVTMARPSLGPGVAVDLSVDLPHGTVMLDADGLADGMVNMMLNARDAMAGHGRIAIRATRMGDWLQLTLSDSGPGFSPEALARGFEPFFTTKAGRGGSGLGLSRVYDFVKGAGGTIRLDNLPDPSGAISGARVRLSLPWRPVEPQMVLLVDDDAAIRQTTREMLTAMGHAVIEAGSLAEALALTDLPGLTLVLSDLQLGDGSGAGLGPAAQAAGLGLILMTALPPGDPRRAGLPVPVLTKPFSAAALAALLTRGAT